MVGTRSRTPAGKQQQQKPGDADEYSDSTPSGDAAVAGATRQQPTSPPRAHRARSSSRATSSLENLPGNSGGTSSIASHARGGPAAAAGAVSSLHLPRLSSSGRRTSPQTSLERLPRPPPPAMGSPVREDGAQGRAGEEGVDTPPRRITRGGGRRGGGEEVTVAGKDGRSKSRTASSKANAELNALLGLDAAVSGSREDGWCWWVRGRE